MAAPPSSLPASLLHRAAVRPHEPWLFFAEGWDWRWRPFGEAAAQVARWTAELGALPEGSAAAFDGRLSPRSVLLDLAIQAAGLVAAPDGSAGGPSPGVRVVVEGDPPGEREPPEAIPTLRLTADAVPTWRGAAVSTAPLELQTSRLAGGAVVTGEAGPAVLSQRDLLAQATGISALLPAPSPRHEITVCARPLTDPIARGLLAWATVGGAAVVLEPDPLSLVPTAVWVRPTVFAGSAAELVQLRAAVERRNRRPRRRALPLGRLRSLFLCGPEPLPDEERAFWSVRGVAVSPFPRMV